MGDVGAVPVGREWHFREAPIVLLKWGHDWVLDEGSRQFAERALG